MRRIRRYFLRECLGPTLIGLLVYTVLFLINLVFQLAELALRRQISLGLLAQFLALALPRLLVITLPMSVLLGILVGVSRLSADSEITALRACGISYVQVLPPLLVLGLAGGLLAGLSSVYLVPEANYAQHRMNAEIFLSGDLGRNIQPRIFYRDIPGVVLYADDREPSGLLRDVILFQRSTAGVGQMTVARSLQIDQDRETGHTRFYLHDGESHEVRPGSPGLYQRTRFEDQVLVRPPDEAIRQFVETLRGPLPRNEREMPTLDLLREAWNPHLGGLSPRRRIRAAMELHRRLAIPPAALILALLGLPLGVVTRRGGRSSGFALSLGVILSYWLLMSAGENLARTETLPVWVAVWAPNILFLLLGLVLMAWLVRDRRLPRFLRRLRPRPPAPGRSAAGPRLPRRPAAPPGGWRLLLPERLDRYVASHYAQMFLLVLATFYVLHLLSDLRTLLDDITGHESVTLDLVVRYFTFASPGMLISGLPLAALLATLLSLGLLERNNEITAMKAAGISLFRASLPLLILGVLLSAAQFAVTDSLLPRANETAASLRAEIREAKPASTFGLRQWIFGSDRRLYNFASYSRARDEYQGVSIYRFDLGGAARLVERIEAASLRYREGRWQLRDGWIRRFGPEGEEFRRFDRLFPGLAEGPDYFRREVRTPAQMGAAELRGYIRNLSQGGYDVREYRVALHEKFAMAGVPAVLVLLGLTFSFRRGRGRSPLAGIGLAIIVTMAFYLFLATFRALGGAGVVPPLVAAWSPGLLFAALGAYRMLSLPT